MGSEMCIRDRTNRADLLTKWLEPPRHHFLLGGLPATLAKIRCDMQGGAGTQAGALAAAIFVTPVSGSTTWLESTDALGLDDVSSLSFKLLAAARRAAYGLLFDMIPTVVVPFVGVAIWWYMSPAPSGKVRQVSATREQAVQTDSSVEPARAGDSGRRAELVWVTLYGECYHVSRLCAAERTTSSLRQLRPCRVCSADV